MRFLEKARRLRAACERLIDARGLSVPSLSEKAFDAAFLWEEGQVNYAMK